MNDTIEATDLYAMVFSEDCKCTSTHTANYNLDCSEEVTHYRRNCKYQGVICTKAALSMLEVAASYSGNCKCGVVLRDCWRITPI